MKLVHGFTKNGFSRWRNIITIGGFDGVHVGHKAIIEALQSQSKENAGKNIIITFTPLPKEFFKKSDFKLLLTQKEKLEILRNLGVDGVCIIPFTDKISKIKPLMFLQELWKYFKPFEIVVGYNHHFGKNGEGGFNILKEFAHKKGILLKKIGKVKTLGSVVSSSRIRQSIRKGEIEIANKMLGRDYFINGRVIRGDGVGRNISYPTANLSVNSSKKLLPKDGVYAVKVELDSKIYGGMLYLGKRPTFSEGNQFSCEVHILGFKGDIYGRDLKVKLLKRIRKEKKFCSAQSLKNQIMTDENTAKKILGSVITKKGGQCVS